MLIAIVAALAAPLAPGASLAPAAPLDLARALDAPEVKDKLRAMGSELPRTHSPQDFGALIERELKLYAKLIKTSGARVDWPRGPTTYADHVRRPCTPTTYADR